MPTHRFAHLTCHATRAPHPRMQKKLGENTQWNCNTQACNPVLCDGAVGMEWVWEWGGEGGSIAARARESRRLCATTVDLLCPQPMFEVAAGTHLEKTGSPPGGAATNAGGNSPIRCPSGVLTTDRVTVEGGGAVGGGSRDFSSFKDVGGRSRKLEYLLKCCSMSLEVARGGSRVSSSYLKRQSRRLESLLEFVQD